MRHGRRSSRRKAKNKLTLAAWSFAGLPIHHAGYFPNGKQKFEVDETKIEDEIQQLDKELALGYDFDTPIIFNGDLQRKILFVS